MSRSSRHPAPMISLGSLTQQGARAGAACLKCGSDRVTRLTMQLTDGSAVDFTSCHKCEHKVWTDAGSQLSVEEILGRTKSTKQTAKK